jgi:hypothetical protein
MFDMLAFVERELQKTGVAPSKRYNRNTSGRASRRQLRGQARLQAVGGMSNLTKAMLAPADTKLCRIVDPRTGWKVDGSPQRL